MLFCLEKTRAPEFFAISPVLSEEPQSTTMISSAQAPPSTIFAFGISVAIVADGMGGHSSGEVASSLAVKVTRDKFESMRNTGLKPGAYNDIFQTLLQVPPGYISNRHPVMNQFPCEILTPFCFSAERKPSALSGVIRYSFSALIYTYLSLLVAYILKSPKSPLL